VVQSGSFKLQQRASGHIYPHVPCCVRDSTCISHRTGMLSDHGRTQSCSCLFTRLGGLTLANNRTLVSLNHVNISALGYAVTLGPQEELFVQITEQINGMCIPRTRNSGRKKTKNHQIAQRNLFRMAVSLPYFSSLSPAIQAV